MELSIPFHAQVELVDFEYFKIEEISTLDLPLVIDNVTSEQETQSFTAEICDSNPEIVFIQTNDTSNKVKLNLGITVIFFKNPTTMFQTAFKNNLKLIADIENFFLIANQTGLLSHFFKTSKHTTVKLVQMTSLHRTL